MSLTAPALLLLACALAPDRLRAEELYVIEQLVVSLNNAPDITGERIASLKSGDRLEVLERSGDQVHVRTGSGREGWIRSSYLSAEEPLRVRLAERTAEATRLKDDVSRLTAELQTARAAAGAAPRAEAGRPAAAAAAEHAEEAVRGPRRSGLFGNGPDEGERRVWPWALAAALAALVIGFALGALVLDRHIRRKYGGLRIY